MISLRLKYNHFFEHGKHDYVPESKVNSQLQSAPYCYCYVRYAVSSVKDISTQTLTLKM